MLRIELNESVDHSGNDKHPRHVDNTRLGCELDVGTGLDDDPGLRFDFVLKLKTPVFETTEITRTSDDEVEALTVMWQVCRAVDEGIFYAIRGWACADCEFGYLCK